MIMIERNHQFLNECSEPNQMACLFLVVFRTHTLPRSIDKEIG